MASLGKYLDVMTQVRRINKQLKTVADKCQGPVGDTLLVQASLMASEMRSLVAVGDDATAGAAKESIRVEQGDPTPKRAIVVLVKAGGPTTTKDGYDHTRALEFGTQKMAAQPFFFSVVRARRKRVKPVVRKAIKLAVRDVFK